MKIEVALDTRWHPAGQIALSDELLVEFEREVQGPDPDPLRLVYAASHVVMDSSYAEVAHSDDGPGRPDEIESYIDWANTMELRRTLADRGFAIAEAMDTAQRFRIGWPAARRLIEECGKLELPTGFVAGAGTDHLDGIGNTAEMIDGVVYQAELIQRAGGEVILLPMHWLTASQASEAEYVEVYRAILRQLDGPIYIHWLGEMFLPELVGYFPGRSFLDVMDLDPSKVRGAKLSLLDAEREIELRRHLADNDQIMLTGDDFHFADLIAGAGGRVADPTGMTSIGARRVTVGEFSHALLGIFDGISRPASVALRRLAEGGVEDYFRIMSAAEKLSRVVFEAPTTYYKSGLAFLAWLNGQQTNCMLVNHEEHMRGREYYVRVAELASNAGVLVDAGLAAERLEEFLERT